MNMLLLNFDTSHRGFCKCRAPCTPAQRHSECLVVGANTGTARVFCRLLGKQHTSGFQQILSVVTMGFF